MSETKLQAEKSPNKLSLVLQEFGVDTSSLTDEELINKLQTSVNNPSSLPALPSTTKEESPLDLAYKISIDYLDTAIKRFDRIDDKIQTLFTFAIGVFAIAPTLLKTNAADKVNSVFWTGIGFLILSGLISIIARTYGKLTILNPEKIYKGGGLETSTIEFKKSVVQVAADAYQDNSKVLETKHFLNIASMAVFGIALIALVYWLIRYAQ